ncbi:linoleate diol synthase [Histoplasma capsulatum var. duboisii H88]|uniref:linoleate 8R-lipoxygenase n=2 Tax=Ajellomyces capsulatus TaxID=5037 RepID=F0ULJ5_AJEC8|nr:linoleate diol synthase [Histoplasma capsulatum H143]EGC47149.1 linoleate diol synthase [Histoplasma capsulatum var. duboisii H88]
MAGFYWTVTAVVAAVSFAVYRYGHDIRQIVAPKSTSPDVKKKDDDGTGIDSGSLVLAIMKHHPKNMDLRRVGDVVKFVKDTIKGKPMNDRLLAMENIIAMVGALPPNNKHRIKLTNILITKLWDSLEHPPINFQGPQFYYRTPDGSYNNVHFPNLGKAGMPYARSIRSDTRLPGVRPDPGLLFDHIFRTDRRDMNINNNSSYLDLSPLYGSSLEDQLKIRTMKNGFLKPDTFHDERLIGQAPGANVLLVLYSRFHNYVAQTLLQINEGGRFTPKGDDEASLAKLDEDLFQTARLIVGGLYINISLHDYLRAITNTHHSASSWTLDPRVDIPDSLVKSGPERGIGNQVTSEFNLLYRFHSCTSLGDEKWLNDYFAGIFKSTGKSLEELTLKDGMQAIARFETLIPKDPSQRNFGGIKRGEDGRFRDEDLVRILKASIEDPAGAFGPKNTPKALRVVEILGIQQARQWSGAQQLILLSYSSSRPVLANTRYSVGGRHRLMSSANSSSLNLTKRSKTSTLTRKSLTISETSMGIPTWLKRTQAYMLRTRSQEWTQAQASARPTPSDYNVATLTNWGMAEVQQDYDTLGGSMFYKLIQRGLPGWFPYNSLSVMQPMYTPDMNREIAMEIGTMFQYTETDPKPPPRRLILTKHSEISQMLTDPKGFPIPFGKPYENFIEGRDFGHFMLAGDMPRNREQRNLYGAALYGSGELKELLSKFITDQTDIFLTGSMFQIGRGTYHVDILKDVAIPVMTRFMGDLFQFDLKTEENTSGTYDIDSLYGDLLNIRIWGFGNDDPAQSWNRRRDAQVSTRRLLASTEAYIKKVTSPIRIRNLVGAVTNGLSSNGINTSLRSFGRDCIMELLANGKSVQEIADIMIFTALGGIGAAISTLAEILEFMIAVPENVEHLEAFRHLTLENSGRADNDLRRYVLEMQRLTAGHVTMRVATQPGKFGNQSFQPGEQIIAYFAAACRDPEAYPEPEKIKLDRPLEKYIAFGDGPHQCFGRELALAYLVGVLKQVTSLKNIRPALGGMGVLKRIKRNGIPYYLSEDWSTFTGYASTWQLQFDDPDSVVS